MRQVIVGGGVAALRAAGAMREAGFDGEVLLVSAEEVLPYDRPPLSKAYLEGRRSAEELQLEPPQFFADRRIDVRLGARAARLLPASNELVLADGRREGYDQLLVATGAEARRLRVPGEELPGVHSLRTLADATRLSGALKDAERVVIVGAGLVGLEVASVARAAGKQVTVLERGATPLRRLLGPFWGQLLVELHREHGVDVRAGAEVTVIGGREQVRTVTLADGTTIPADLVLVAVGVRPVVDWLSGSGVELDDGVVVDAFGRTHVPGVFAAGDVAVVPVPRFGRRMRLEQFGHAQAHGAAVGRTMAGLATAHAAIPAGSSAMFGVRVQAFGVIDDTLRSVVRGDVQSRKFVALFVDDEDRVQGALAVGSPKEGLEARRQVIASERLDGRALLDAIIAR